MNRLRPIRVALLLVAVLAAPSWAVQRRGFRAPHMFRPPAAARRRPLGAGLARLSKLPPQKQEQVLRQDQAFQRLPPEKQQQVLKRLKWFNTLPPDKQEAVLQRMRRLGEMTPEQRNGLERLFQDWKTLPPPRQQQMRQAYANLRKLPPQQQEARLNNPNFQLRHSPQEIDMLRRALALDLPNDAVGTPPQ